MTFTIDDVAATSPLYDLLLTAAEHLNRERYIAVQEPHIDQSIVVGAFLPTCCIGFLRFSIHVIGRDVGRPPIQHPTGTYLREGFVEAFGVLPAYRRHGVGQTLQEYAIATCRAANCYQIRSRSPITSVEKYALKLKMGYTIHPISQNDSYYFMKLL